MGPEEIIATFRAENEAAIAKFNAEIAEADNVAEMRWARHIREYREAQDADWRRRMRWNIAILALDLGILAVLIVGWAK